MPRRALLILVLLTSVAHADKDADTAKQLLDTLSTSASKDERVAAAAKLAELAPHVVPQLAEFLKRSRTATVDQRRNVLKAIHASIPDKNGNFASPGHEKAEKIRAEDEYDWLAALVELSPQTGLGEVIADDAAIRALAATKQTDAADAILDVAFGSDTIIYRDECGRYLRRMSPYSVPALIVASQGKKGGTRTRYTNYQLERMDRQEPQRALQSAADDEDLLVAILNAYGDTEHREAVGAVVSYLNSDAPRVREAARKAWIQYVTPPDPPPAKKGYLKMTGGVESETKKPLWKNSLELARIETARVYDELFHETLADDADDPTLQAASERIFKAYDDERAGRDSDQVREGQGKAANGDLAGAVAIFDRLIAENPQRAERAQMAETYFAYAEQLAGDQTWDAASAMYSKAQGLAPDGPHATDALAAHYYALGKAQEAAGKDGSASYRKAVELKPDYAEAKQAEKQASSALGGGSGGKAWMLYVAAAVAAGALALLGMGLMRRPVRR